MTTKCFIGVDLGAETGRVMAGLWDGARMRLEEVHRFPNASVPLGDSLRWDVLHLLAEVEDGLSAAAKRYTGSICSIGVDSWGVDFALLTKSEELLGWPRHYRDPRNVPAIERLLNQIPREEIFAASGIQFMPINTLCQLVAMREENPELLDNADLFLMIADFVHWALCGSRVVEFTNATTTQLYHPREARWAVEILERLGINRRMLPEVVAPGARLGKLRASVSSRTSLSGVEVIAPATHDTGSAVAAIPTARTGQANWAYISSGTWSLIGLELSLPMLSKRALEHNFTNEGGVDGSYRFLKNVMGLWLVQQCRRSFERAGRASDYAGLMHAAEKAAPFRSLIDPDDTRFLNPAEMPDAIAQFCRETNQPVPEDEGAFVRCALESLALKYALVLEGFREVTGDWVEVIHIVGGGSRNALLNQFAANACGRPVMAGPAEATVMGNVLVQARAAGDLGSLDDIRRVAWGSSAVEEFAPKEQGLWREAGERFVHLVKTAL